ncbi:MAG: LysR family transcriptional regulator, partial [Pseudomonadota bacterium]
MADTQPNIAERATDLALVRSLVAHGYGYSLVNIGTEHTLSPEGIELAFRPVREPVKPLMLGLATMRADQRSAIVAAFFDHVAGIDLTP